MRRWFYAIAILQVVFLLGQAGKTEMDIRRAPTVILKVVPVDPRSLFMGNFMALAYDITTIDLGKVAHDPAVESVGYGDKVYVSLTPSASGARVTSVGLSQPSGKGAALCLEGSISYGSENLRSPRWAPRARSPKAGPKPVLSVEYGIERYFIPETKQEEVNRLAASQWGGKGPKITAEIAVTPGGKGLVRRVLVDGKPLQF